MPRPEPGDAISGSLASESTNSSFRQDFAGSFEPVLGERRLQALHQVAGDADHGIAPGALFAAGPIQ